MNEFIQLFKGLKINSGTIHSHEREPRVAIAKKCRMAKVNEFIHISQYLFQ
jgi:hypothetical protein